MADFRVDTVFLRHSKTKRLRRMLGLDGVFALMRLWAYATDCKYDSEHVYSADDIGLAVDWDKDKGSLVEVLSAKGINFINTVEGGYVVNQWDALMSRKAQ